ncbi:hypothetical protein [Pseudomonas denitrificans (nom. rej.)]|uniref:Uncharacterized protein n=1 Tax=Pseudomonas denitrificans TaxID=43306 RepID=A0A9X7N145_PSEDE|nr:hypothetical protein [Pseudomonas denitrificans (nom. rej.)]QEY73242.1 hypothetical protein F1C79_17440 [Pseudomonas denitrificans (nom. rej.)]
MTHPENTPAPPETQELRTALEVTNDVLAILDSGQQEPQESRAALEIAQELLECMEAEITQIMELRAILVAVYRDPEATAHIKSITGAGINASHFVSKGLEVMALMFKEELVALEQPELAVGLVDGQGGAV